MKPPDFEYARPSSLADAVALLAGSHGEGKVLAGGQSLVPLLNFRLAAPRLLVDLNRVPELSFLERDDGYLRIGATTRMRAIELDPLVRQTIPLLADAASWVGHIQIRNRGTVGGSVAHADPAAEIPAICLLLDAELTALGPAGERRITADDFFVGFLTTTLGEDEILTEIRVPIPAPGERWAFREFAQRRGDFALAGCAASLALDAEGRTTAARLVVFGGVERPIRPRSAEASLHGRQPTMDAVAEAARLAADEATIGDTRPDSGYRRALVQAMLYRALADATNRR